MDALEEQVKHNIVHVAGRKTTRASVTPLEKSANSDRQRGEAKLQVIANEKRARAQAIMAQGSPSESEERSSILFQAACSSGS